MFGKDKNKGGEAAPWTAKTNEDQMLICLKEHSFWHVVYDVR